MSARVLLFVLFGLALGGCATDTAGSTASAPVSAPAAEPSPDDDLSPSPSPWRRPARPTPPTPTSEPPATSPLLAAPPTTSTPTLPEELLGLWQSSGGDAEILYRFDPDGTYAYVGILTQQRASGLFEFIVEEEGTFQLDGPTMLVQPESGTQRLSDPDSPSSNWERPVDLAPRALSWNLTGGVLTLIDEQGLELTFERIEE